MSQVLLMTVARSGVVDALASLCIEQLLLTLSNDLQGGECVVTGPGVGHSLAASAHCRL